MNPMFGRKGSLAPHWKGGARKMSSGRIQVLQPNHPRATKKRYVSRAVLGWEQANNQPFPEGKEPHHINGIRDDDRPENILPITPSEHSKLHNLKGHKYPRRKK